MSPIFRYLDYFYRIDNYPSCQYNHNDYKHAASTDPADPVSKYYDLHVDRVDKLVFLPHHVWRQAWSQDEDQIAEVNKNCNPK